MRGATIKRDDQYVQIISRKGTVLLDLADAAIVDKYYIWPSRSRSSSYTVAEPRGGGVRRKLARILLNAPADRQVDHINGNPLDNRRANLRLVTLGENNRNHAKRAGCASGFKGVARRWGKWGALIYPGGKQKHLGNFETEVEAALAYDAAAREVFGEHATLNFPREGEQTALRPHSRSFCSGPLYHRGAPE